MRPAVYKKANVNINKVINLHITKNLRFALLALAHIFILNNGINAQKLQLDLLHLYSRGAGVTADIS